MTFSTSRVILTIDMDVNEIVNEIATQGLLHNIIMHITKGKSPDPEALKDLEQDIYVSLLGKGGKLIEVWDDGHINYYLSRIVCNNIMSSSSPYYRNYIKPYLKNVTLNGNIKTDI